MRIEKEKRCYMLEIGVRRLLVYRINNRPTLVFSFVTVQQLYYGETQMDRFEILESSQLQLFSPKSKCRVRYGRDESG